MKLSTIRAAAKRVGLTVVKTSEAGDAEDGEITLSNGVSIQLSSCGTPVGVTGVVEIPEWTMFDKYWEETPTAYGVMLEALALQQRMKDHLAKYPKKEEITNGH